MQVRVGGRGGGAPPTWLANNKVRLAPRAGMSAVKRSAYLRPSWLGLQLAQPFLWDFQFPSGAGDGLSCARYPPSYLIRLTTRR